MQRTGVNRRIKEIIIYVAVFLALIAIDQITKFYFKNKYFEDGTTKIINNFFYFTYAENTGAAFSFLAGKSWAQLFFKIITAVALVVFTFLTVYFFKKKQKWLTVSMIITLSGTIGNYIDRLALNYVRDFISFVFGSYRFPVFNIADVCLVVGVIMISVYLLFLDKDAVFKRKNGKEDIQDCWKYKS